MQQHPHVEETTAEQQDWEAPELVKADVAEVTLNGAVPGVDGPGLLS